MDQKCRLKCDFFTDFDLFGKNPEFFYKSKSKKTSYVGTILSFFYVILYIAFFIFKLVRMIKKLDIDFYETYSFTGIPSITLNHDNFYAGFSVGGIVDKTIYYPAFQYWVESRTDGVKNEPIVKNVELEVCQLEKFGKNHQELFKDKPLQNFYCIKNVQEDLIGYGSLDKYSYYYIMIFPCIGTHPDGTPCKPLNKVTEFFQRTFLEFTLQDIELTPKDYYNPSYPLTKDITTPVFQGLYQSIFAYFQIVNVDTDLDVLGFEALSSDSHEKFIKYDESWIIASPTPHINQLNDNYPVCDVTIQLAAKVLTIKRTNTKLIDVLGDVGGLMEFIWSFFNILSMFITDLLYDIDLVNNLFSFDLDKKVVLIKDLKYSDNNKNNLKEDENIKSTNLFDVKNTIEQIHQRRNMNTDRVQFLVTKDENTIENTINQDIKTRMKNKKISRRRQITNTYRINKLKDDKDSNSKVNIEDNFDKNKINQIKQNEMNKGTLFSNNLFITNEEPDKTIYEKGNMLDTIYINNFFVIFAFCCIRKRKNVNSYVLEEGLNIIKERLDILNIFKKLYCEEQILEVYKIKKNEIKMSDDCKIKLK